MTCKKFIFQNAFAILFAIAQSAISATVYTTNYWDFSSVESVQTGSPLIGVGAVSSGNSTATFAINSTSASSGYSGASGGENAVTKAAASQQLDASKSAYFEFTVTPDPTVTSMKITKFSFGSRSTPTGPVSLAVCTNSSIVSVCDFNASTGSWAKYSADDVCVITGNVTIRIYGYGNTSTGNNNWRIDDLEVCFETEIAGNDNSAPVLSVSPEEVPENIVAGDTLDFLLSATDTDGDTVSYSARCSGVESVADSMNSNTGVFAWTPPGAGVYEIIFTADDGIDSDSKTVTVNVGLAAPSQGTVTNEAPAGFTVSWTPVPGAELYLVDIATDSSFDDGAPDVFLSEDFASLTDTEVPAGWESSSTSDLDYTQTVLCGGAAPAYKFKEAGQTLESPEFETGSQTLSFFSSGNDNSGSTLSIYGRVGGVWVKQGDFISITNGSAEYVVPLDNVVDKLRFMFEARVMNFSLDDVAVYGPAGQNTLAVQGESTTNTFFDATGLSEGRTYYIKARAVGGGGSVTGSCSAVWTGTTKALEVNKPPKFIGIDTSTTSVFAGETVYATLYGMDENVEDVLTYSIVSGFGELSDNRYSWTPTNSGTYKICFGLSDQNGDSSYTNIIVTVGLNAPAGIVFTNKTETSFTIAWDSVPGATEYLVDLIKINDNRDFVFFENFSGFTNAPSGRDVSTNLNSYTSDIGWSGASVYKGVGGASEDELGGFSGGIKLGGGSVRGWIETPSVDISSGKGLLSIEFDARAWNGDKTNNALIVSVGDTFVITNSLSYDVGKMVVTGCCESAIGSVRLSAVQVTGNRYYLDNLVVATGEKTESLFAKDVRVSEPFVDFNYLDLKRKYRVEITAIGNGMVISEMSSEIGEPSEPSKGTVFIIR